MSGHAPARLIRAPVCCPRGVDETRYFVGDWWKDLDLPLDWGALLGSGPLWVEVGYGGGEFLAGMSALFPDRRFVGIERYGEGHRRLLAALSGTRGAPVASLVGDAYVLMNLAFADASASAVVINFSDPWPKARHARNRLLSPEFFSIISRKLAPGGILYVATDDEPYARQAAQAFDQEQKLASLHEGRPWLGVSPHPLKTRYEERWTAAGKKLCYFMYERK